MSSEIALVDGWRCGDDIFPLREPKEARIPGFPNGFPRSPSLIKPLPFPLVLLTPSLDGFGGPPGPLLVSPSLPPGCSPGVRPLEAL